MFETFFINELRPSLNVPSDSRRAEVFKWLVSIVVLSLHALLHSFRFSNIFIVLNIFYTLHIYMLILLTFYLLENDRRSVETSFFYA